MKDVRKQTIDIGDTVCYANGADVGVGTVTKFTPQKISIDGGMLKYPVQVCILKKVDKADAEL